MESFIVSASGRNIKNESTAFTERKKQKRGLFKEYLIKVPC